MDAEKQCTEPGKLTERPESTPPGTSNTAAEYNMSKTPESVKLEKSVPKTFRFYSIIAAATFCSVLTGLEGSIIPTSLPSIISDLGGGQIYIWSANAYYLAM
jgi:hypothetical protein